MVDFGALPLVCGERFHMRKWGAFYLRCYFNEALHLLHLCAWIGVQGWLLIIIMHSLQQSENKVPNVNLADKLHQSY